jgi:glycosyltransferase involved in cell wall biosynthesis
MRIAFVLTQDLESPSGLGRYLPLARQLVLRGHQVYISALHPDYQALSTRNFIQDGVHINYVAPMHVRKQGNLKQYYGLPALLAVTVRATWGLSIDTLRTNAAIIHVGKPHPMNSVAGLLGKLRRPQGLCVDCDDYEAGSMTFSSGWQKWLVTQFERRVPKMGQIVTVNTQFMRQKLVDWGVQKEKIVYLPNGVDRGRLSSYDPEKVAELRRSLGLEGKQVIAYLGSLSLPSHPVDLLLRAFSQINGQSNQIKLLIVGGGSDYPTLIGMAKNMGLENSVIFTGHVAPQEVPTYYRLADVTVDPVYDNDAARGRSPLKLFESWASGVPFVTSRVGDRTTILEASRAGKLTDDSTPEAYARAILDVLSQASLADELHQNGLSEVENYTWDRLAARLDQAYLGLLGKAAQ